jgi:hypothetical protein
MKSVLGRLLATLACLWAATAHAWPEYLRGEPTANPALRFRVWIDKNENFQVAFGGGDGQKRFSIRSMTDGHLDSVAAQGPKGEKLDVEQSGMTAELSTAVRHGSVRFEVEGGTSVTLFLRYDGLPVAAKEIALGARAAPPERNPVSFQRTPAAERPGARHDHPKDEHHHHRHKHPHPASDHHHHPHDHPHPIGHGHHPH